jgi:tetratricopeptide (TPR) repeat protein
MPVGKASILVRIGSVQIGMGNYQEARLVLEQSLTLLEQSEQEWRASALIKLGTIECAQGHSLLGQHYYREALALYEQHHNQWESIGVLHNLGIEQELAGDWVGAEAEYRQALALAKHLNHVTRQRLIELSLAILLTNRGKHSEAAHYLEQGLSKIAAESMQEVEIGYRSSLADLFLRRGERDAAEPHLREAERLALDLGSTYQLPEIYRGWALYWLASDASQALQYAEQALMIARQLDEPLAEGISLRVLGLVHAALQQSAAAREALTASCTLLLEQDGYEAARSQIALSELATALGDVETAQQLAATARATFAELGALYDLHGERANE